MTCGESYLQVMEQTLELVKNSQGYINISIIEELDYFEFLLYYSYFKEEYTTMKDTVLSNKKDMEDLLIESVKALIAAK